MPLLLWGVNLSVDESLLTGESVAVRKSAGRPDAEMQRPGGEDTPLRLFRHPRRARPGGGGREGHRGRLGDREDREGAADGAAGADPAAEGNRLHRQDDLHRRAGALRASWWWCTASRAANWLEGILSGITLAMAMLPEEFPVVLTIFLALGAWRISQNRVLARRMAAVETLGAATVLCTDKTGTLTQNRMKIRMLRADGRSLDLTEAAAAFPRAFHELLEFGILASQEDPFDPMEKAIHEVGAATLTDTEHLHDSWTLVQQYPLSRELLALSHVWKSVTGPGTSWPRRAPRRPSPISAISMPAASRPWAARCTTWRTGACA